MKKTSSILFAVVLVLSLALATPVVQAATPQEIADAIEDGIAWLVSVQNTSDGSWGPSEGDQASDRFGTTGLILVKLQDRAFELGFDGPFDDDYPFKENVVAGLNFLLSYAGNVTITTQLAGNPDTDGDGCGVCVGLDSQITYNTGILMMAIAAGRDPNRVAAGPLAGWTYGEVLQDMVDWMAYAQADNGTGRGGWYYWQMNGGYKADQSNSGYAILGLLYAQAPLYHYQCDIPDFVATELNHWIDYIQVDDDPDTYGYHGGSGYGYDSPRWLVNSLKTGNLLTQMAFVGDVPSDTRVVDALDYIGRHWSDDWVQGWGKNGRVLYQATYCLMKGFQIMGIPVSGVPGVVDWYDDMATKLLAEKNTNGSWPSNPACIKYQQDSHNPLVEPLHDCSAELSTAWALLTLERSSPPPLRQLDHFTCYGVSGVEPIGEVEVVELEDRFGAVNATVESAGLFCNPVHKVHGNVTTPILNQDHHLTCYSINHQGAPRPCSVKIDNQFGTQQLNLSGPVALAVPTQKVEPGDHEPPVGLDHFLLYQVIEGPDADVVVGLNDQFGNATMMVTTPLLFATPVRKTHGGNVTEIENPYASLVFYGVEGGVIDMEVQVTNQFGNQTFDVAGPVGLAVPSEILPYQLNISRNRGGWVSIPGEGTFTYDPCTVVNLSVFAPDNCYFVKWTGDVGTIADANAYTTTIIMNGDYSITANFICGCGGLTSTSAYGTPIAEEVQALLGLLVLVSVPAALWVKRRRGRDSEYS